MIDEKSDLIFLNNIILTKARDDNFSGYDPFDLLNSRLLKSTPFIRSEFFRLVWLQFGKNSPINFRPFLRVPKKRNPKGVALFIFGLLEEYQRTDDSDYLKEAQLLGTWLVGHCCDLVSWQHYCWGYHFDWQARAFFVPRGKPNIITTCYVARALYELGKVANDKGLIDIALDAAIFISKSLYTEIDGQCFYSYIPGERAFVHNASLWGAAWCGFVGGELNNRALQEQARRVAMQSVDCQNHDGSWVYGARHHHQFIDCFHTGYNLEALCILRDALETNDFDRSIAIGYDYYLENFLEDDGVVKYYNNKKYPIDMHNVSQAIFTLIKVGGKPSDFILCEKVVNKAVKLLYHHRKNQFIYQKRRWFTNTINYSRWTQAWSFYSLAFYNRTSSTVTKEK